MIGPNLFHQRLPLVGGGNPAAAAAAASPVMMYGVYPKTNGALATYTNQTPAAAEANTAMFHHTQYGFPLNSFVAAPISHEDEDEAAGLFEVMDSHWKAPISVNRSVVSPSMGSQILFDTQRLTSGTGNRNPLRVCEAFQEGHCSFGEKCNDIHVYPEYLKAKKQAMLSWLREKEREFQKTLLHDKQKTFRFFCADLKEVVEVPISALRFTKGLYVDPSLRARRVRSGHQNQFALIASQVPTACGLFSEDPSQCKWGMWCNQVHVEQGWMQSKKREFESWSNNLEQCFNELPPDHLFLVHDPQLKSTLSLPKASIAGFSRGLFQGTPKKSPSVCMLFQRGRCTANTCCNQIHVDPSYLQLHRRWVCDGEQLPEEKQRELQEQMNSLLISLSSNDERYARNENNMNELAKMLNPQAQPFVPSPSLPPQHPSPISSLHFNGKTVSDKMMVNKEKMTFDRPCVQGKHKRNSLPSVLYPPISSTALCEAIPAENELVFPLEDSPEANTLSRPPHKIQQQESLYKNVSTHAASNNKPLSRGNNYTGGHSAGLELISVVDGDERSQSSLQESHSSIAGRGHRHTNNPYAFGGSVSCAASISFGWVQPVRSAGNSCTTAPTSGFGAEASRSNSNFGFGIRARTDTLPAAHDNRSALWTIHPDFDCSFHASSTNPHWNASSSVSAKTMEEPQRPTFDMEHVNAGDFVSSNKM